MKKEVTRAEIVSMIEKSVGKKPSESVREANNMALRALLSEQKRASQPDTIKNKRTIGGIAVALAAAKGHHLDAARYAEQKWGADDDVTKALQASTDIYGGFTIREELATTLIEALEPVAIMRRMGCDTIPLVDGQMRVPKENAGITAAYLSEGSNIAASQDSYGQVMLQGKKIGAKVPISNDLLKFSALNVEQRVTQNIVKRIALREDLAFLEGNGALATPVGIRNLLDPANAIAMTATPTAATATTDATRMVNLLDNANVPDTRRGWIMRPAQKNWLAGIREATGALAFPEMQGANPVFWGYPVATTTQLTIDVAGPPTQNYMYLCEFPMLIIGDAYSIELKVSDDAAYTDDTGTLVSAFDRDETVVRAIAMHDFGVKHDEAIAALTGVTWGGG